MDRRNLLKIAGAGVAAAVTPSAAGALNAQMPASAGAADAGALGFSVGQFGAKGDGAAIAAIDRAIAAAAAAGGER